MEASGMCFPHLNTSCVKRERPHAEAIFIYLLQSLISLLTAALNLLVIISVSHFKQLHTPTNLLLLSLATSDFFVSILMVFQILIIDGCWTLGDLMCSLYLFFDYLITSTSVGNMVLISIDRYIAICDPLRYPKKVTPKRVQVCISLCWCFSFVWISVLLRENLGNFGKYKSCSGECVVVLRFFEQVIDCTLIFILPITVISVLYTQIFMRAVFHARVMRSSIASVTLQQSKNVRVKRSELKAARTVGVILFVFLICIIPNFCVTIAGQDTMLNPSSISFVICLFYLNSFLNPLIYALAFPWFRKSVRLIFTLQILKPDSCDANMI